MSELNQLYDERNKLDADMRTMLDTADAESRDLTADETETYNQMDSAFDLTDKKVKDCEAAKKAKEDRLKKAVEREERLNQSQYEPTRPIPQSQDAPVEHATEDRAEAFKRYLVDGKTEGRALQKDVDTGGGYLTTPEKFMSELIKDLNNMVHIRQYARTFSVPKAQSLGFPKRANRMGDVTWTSELKIGAEDSTLDFAKRTLYPHPLARYIKVSKELLRVSVLNIDAIVRDEFVYEFATVEESAFMTGTGVDQPLGVFTASNLGISTGRDVSTANTNTAIKADNLINVVYNQKAQYRKGARWLFHRDALKMIAKLKDGEGNYLLQRGLAEGRPDTILGIPFDESEYAPSTFTTGLYVGILANWGQYWIADALDMDIQVLLELYAATNQNCYIGRKATDGMPVDENAFTRVKLG